MVAKPAIVGIVGGVAVVVALGLNFWVLSPDEEPAVDQASVPGQSAAPVPTRPPVPAQPSAAAPSGQGAGSASVQAPAGAPAASDASATPPRVQQAPVPDDPATRRPNFDVVRVDPDGNAVIAGRGKPNTEVTIMEGDRELGRVTSDDRGEWVYLPDEALGPGQFAFSLRQGGDPDTAESEEAVIIVVPEPGKDIAGRPVDQPSQPLAMVLPRDEASQEAPRILQAPEAGPAAASEVSGDAAAQTSAAAAAAPESPQPATAQTAPGPTASAAADAASTADAAPAADVDARPAPRTPAESAGAASSAAVAQRPASPGSSAGSGPGPAPTVAQSATDPADPDDASAAPSAQAPLASTESAADRTVAQAPALPAGSPGAGTPPAAPSGDAEATAAAAPGDQTPPSEPATRMAALPSASPAPSAGAESTPAPAPVVHAFPEATAPPAAPVEPAVPGAPPESVKVDVIEYDDEGDVVFGGSTEPNAEVEVFIDEKPAGTAVADDEGRWQLSPTQPVAPGNYNLRVDKVAPGGKVKARVAFPFVRATPLQGLPDGRLVVIQPGNNLWRIATRVYGEGIRYLEIHDANKDQIQNPDLIYPGQVFGLPTVN
jgi:nucleoid-associated protein YgaU